MNYLDVYFSRINHMGKTTAERIQNSGIKSFNKWMAESPHTIANLSVERGIYFDGIILTSKDKEYEKIMFLNVGNNVPIQIGDILNWQIENGNIEKWLLIQEEKKVNGTYRTFWMVRCNYLMKWIDNDGHIQQSWSYFVSSLSDKIKGNFRTWHSLITPQPNKYAELLMPRYSIERSTNFIVEEESWNVVEYDHTSVPGVMYISLTEGKINSIYDDVKNNIADLDKQAKYELILPETTQSFQINQSINLVFTVTKDGKPFEGETELIPNDSHYVQIIDGQLIGIRQGTTDIMVVLKDYPDFKKLIPINITSAMIQFSAYIKGSNTIRVNRDEIYELIGTQEINGPINFNLDSSLATISSVENNRCVIHANNKNILGEITLIATYNNKTYEKVIRIVPLW